MHPTTYIATVWIWPAAETGKQPTRKVLRIPALDVDRFKGYIVDQTKISYGSGVVVEFGPVSVAQRQVVP